MISVCGSPQQLLLPGLANQNTEYPVKFEFQISNTCIFSISKYVLNILIQNSDLTGSPVFYLATLIQVQLQRFGDGDYVLNISEEEEVEASRAAYAVSLTLPCWLFTFLTSTSRRDGFLGHVTRLCLLRNLLC